MHSMSEVISMLGSRVIEVSEGPAVMVLGFAALTPGKPNYMSFVSARHSTPEQALLETASSVILVPAGSVGSQRISASRNERWVITVERPRLEFARLSAALFPEVNDAHVVGVHETALIGEGTILGSGVVLGPGVVIGQNCMIGPNVVIERGCRIGNDVVVGPGSCIGRAGFGFERDELGAPIRLPHYAAVTIGDGVEIGSNTVIDRGVFNDTLIRDWAKIDSQVLVGHNGVVGKGSYVIGGSVLCGGVDLGEASWIGPGAVIKEKLSVGEAATVGIGAAVYRDVPPGGEVMGFPARPTLKSGSTEGK